MDKEIYSTSFFNELDKIARGPLASKAATAAKSAKEVASSVASKVKGKIPPKILEFMKKHKLPLAFGGGMATSDFLKSREKSAAGKCPGGKIKSKGKGKGLGFGKGKGPVGVPKE